MSSEGTVAKLDELIASFFATGNVFTVLLAGILVIFLLWPIITGKDPDIHPFLLIRQAQASPVRQPGESAVYRSAEIPYGYPLRKGLGVKDAGAPAWTPGRDGDLRDIWKKAVQGATDDKGTPSGKKGKILSVLGKEKVTEQSMTDMTKIINAIGEFVKSKSGSTVAISLSNSIELLAVIFASAFYDFKPVLIPSGLDQSELQKVLSQIRADVLIGEAATFDVTSALSVAPSIKHVIWVVPEGSRHIDWAEKPAGVGQLGMWQWHDIVADSGSSSEVPTFTKDSKPGPIAAFWKAKGNTHELVEYTSSNIVAGVGGLLSTLSRNYKLTEKDLLLPLASLTESYTLCWTLAAFYCNASIALNSVSGDSVDLLSATTGIRPTVIVASSASIAKYYKTAIALTTPGLVQKFSNFMTKRDMKAGYMSDKKPSDVVPSMSKLRLIFVSQRDTDAQSKLSSSVFAGLRLTLGTRAAYALTSKSVAGAISQNNVLDYLDKGGSVCLGSPVQSVEVYVRGEEQALESDTPTGKLVVKGPSVIGGKAELDVVVQIDLDKTLTLP